MGPGRGVPGGAEDVCPLALAGAASASEGASGGSVLIQPQLGTIIWTTITFLILMFLIYIGVFRLIIYPFLVGLITLLYAIY